MFGHRAVCCILHKLHKPGWTWTLTLTHSVLVCGDSLFSRGSGSLSHPSIRLLRKFGRFETACEEWAGRCYPIRAVCLCLECVMLVCVHSCQRWFGSSLVWAEPADRFMTWTCLFLCAVTTPALTQGKGWTVFRLSELGLAAGCMMSLEVWLTRPSQILL